MYEDWNNELWSSSLYLGTQNQIKYKFGTVYQLAFISAPGRVSDVSETTYERLCTLKHMQVHVGYI